MKKQTEALKIAIEALETCTEYSGYEYWFDGDVVRNALKIAREALEQPAQICEVCGSTMTDEELAERKKTNPKLISCCPDRKMLEQPAQWISVKDRLPEVKSGNAKEFIVVIYSGYTGRSFVTSRHFLNKMELYNEYSDNDFDEVSGWHERTYHLEYDDYYTLVDSCNADAVRYEVTHWMPLPDAPKEQA